jgi:hypothetical protein
LKFLETQNETIYKTQKSKFKFYKANFRLSEIFSYETKHVVDISVEADIHSEPRAEKGDKYRGSDSDQRRRDLQYRPDDLRLRDRLAAGCHQHLLDRSERETGHPALYPEIKKSKLQQFSVYRQERKDTGLQKEGQKFKPASSVFLLYQKKRKFLNPKSQNPQRLNLCFWTQRTTKSSNTATASFT